MDLSYPADAEEFRIEIRAWLEEHLPDGWFDEGFKMTPEEKAAWNDEWTTTLFEGGWPEEYGGKGLSTMQGVVLAEEFAKAKAPMRADFFGDTLVGPTILMNGTEEQKKYFLPKILDGSMRWCQGFSEPDSGSDLASLKTTAVLDGDEWVINGQKVWTSGAHFCDFGIVLVRTDPSVPKHKGLTMFYIDMKSPGVEVRPIRQMSGDAHFNEVFFTDVRVKDSQRLGKEGEGWKVALTTLMNERASIGSGMGLGRGPGPFERIIALTEVMGRSQDPIIRDHLARLYIQNRVLGYTGKRALANLKAGGVPGPEMSILKLAGGGTDEIVLNIIGERVLGLPREPKP